MRSRLLAFLVLAGGLALACSAGPAEPETREEPPSAQVRAALAWSQVATITPPDSVQFRAFGSAVLAPPNDPRVFVKDARNSVVYVFTTKADGTYAFDSQLVRSGTKPLVMIPGLAAGDLMATGAPTSAGTADGNLFVFRRDASGWSLSQELASPIARQSLGWSVAYDNQRLAASAPDDGGNKIGGVHLFERVNGTWTRTSSIAPPPEGVGMVAEFGRYVAFGPDTLAVTSSFEDAFKGALYVYARSGATYGAPQRIPLGNPQVTNGEICFVGDALLLTSSSGARVFRKGASGWAQVGTLDGPATYGPPLLRCDGERAALVLRGVGARIWAPQGTAWVDAKIDLGLSFAQDFALRGNRFFAGDNEKVAVFAYSALRGEPCKAAAECTSGFCVDGVCCDTACGGGGTNDCQACSVQAGAAANGTCGPVAAARSCRAARGACDVEERCDGVSTTCPADGVVANGTACENGGTCSAGVCSSAAAPVGTEPPPLGSPDGAAAAEDAPAGGCAMSRARPTSSAIAGLAATLLILAARRRKAGRPVARSSPLPRM